MVTETMPDKPIRVERLGKLYHIGRRAESYQTLRQVLTEGVVSRFRNAGRFLTRRAPESHESEILWALRDVSFEIEWGEVVGIIGRNGAGKSTLLKILSRITEPTEGVAEIRGRVGSLLEVGTGFHSELTGRENVFLNGAILGMKKSDILARFDEIVEFSGVAKFIDTPVKHYSSGMHVRLAFAVAAHLEPEILIVDEALAVGDAAFQKKCISKMGDVARGGRTVLLVTHNMGFISALTQRAMILQEGKLTFMGSTPDAIAAYFEEAIPQSEEDLREHPNRPRGMTPALTAARIKDASGRLRSVFVTGEEWYLEIDYATHGGVELAGAGFNVYTASGIVVGGLQTYMLSPPPYSIPGDGRLRFCVKDLCLYPGEYFVNISLSTDPEHDHDWIPKAVGFAVEKNDPYGNGYVLKEGHGGVCTFRGSYEVQEAETVARGLPFSIGPGVALRGSESE
jgi:lipopolysaccharide transport system ATP-binding protein